MIFVSMKRSVMQLHMQLIRVDVEVEVSFMNTFGIHDIREASTCYVCLFFFYIFIGIFFCPTAE